MKLKEIDLKILRGVSIVSGLFTVMIAITMIFSLLQLKIMDPVNTPSLQSVKEQFDRDSGNAEKAAQIRALDLMARKAYFSSRWQVETGSYLMLAGALVFVFCQRMISGNEKIPRPLPGARPDIVAEKNKSRQLLIVLAGVLVVLAIVSTFILRKELPSPLISPSAGKETAPQAVSVNENIQINDISFPFFRGEGSRGLAGGTGYPTDWNGNDGKNIKWKIPVPKPGKNSPVIWENKLFFTGSENGTCEVYCIDKNKGEILWTANASGFPGASKTVPESDPEAGMAVPTAAVFKDGICALFGNGNLVCFDSDGKLKWGKNLGVPKSSYGFSSSLLIFRNLVIVQYDSQEKISLSGFDIITGEKKWETPRRGRPVNSSPILQTFDGQPQILINGNPEVSSYDPVTGNELWSQPGVSGDVAPSLAANSKLVYAVTDYYKLLALKPGKSSAPAWEDNTFTPDVSSPVANDKFLFVTTGNGDAACYSAEKGDTLWSHYFGDQFYASPVICDNKVWMLDRSGNMHIVEAAGKFKLISEPVVGEKTDCTPVFSEKKIYLKGRKNLYCISAN